MQFTIPVAFMALIGSVFAQTANFNAILSPTEDEKLIADGKQSYKIVWDPTTKYDGQSVSIRLLQGASEGTLDFYPGDNIASSIDSALGSYTWTPESSIVGYATYGLKLQLDSDTSIFQYSFPFKIVAGSASSSTSVVSTSSDASSSSSSSSSSSEAAAETTAANAAETPSVPAATSVTPTDTSAATTTATGSAAQTTLATTSRPTSTGSATTSATSAIVTAGAGRVAAAWFAASVGVMAAMMTL